MAIKPKSAIVKGTLRLRRLGIDAYRENVVYLHRECLPRQARHVDVQVTHALFVNDARHRLKEAGVRNVWSTGSIGHESNIIPLNGLLGGAVLTLA